MTDYEIPQDSIPIPGIFDVLGMSIQSMKDGILNICHVIHDV